MAILFQAARPEDDAALRAALRDNVMQGGIAVSFRREPSYFAASAVQGVSAQVFKGVDGETGALAGVGGRFRLPAYINGALTDIGYLADLRVLPRYRIGMGLRRAFDFLRTLHEAEPLPLYTTMILKDNLPALNVLARGRAGMPPYLPQGFVHTPMLLMGRRRAPIRLHGVSVRPAVAADIPQLFDFLHREHARYQFAPHYLPQDLNGGRLHGLNTGDFLLAFSGSRIVGALACWEQSALRQIHVEAYNGAWRWGKPLYNAFAGVARLPKLPETGGKIRCGYVALRAVENGDSALFALLLRALYRRHCGSGLHYLVCPLHESDPLLPVVRDYARIDAGGHLFTVQFDETPYPLDARVPYIEAAAL